MFECSVSVVARVVGELLFFYGLLGWVYGVLIQLTHPYWLSYGLSHLIPWIRIDTFTVLSFILSALGFLMWRLAKESVRSAAAQTAH
jgi:hypothetical protein